MSAAPRGSAGRDGRTTRSRRDSLRSPPGGDGAKRGGSTSLDGGGQCPSAMRVESGQLNLGRRVALLPRTPSSASIRTFSYEWYEYAQSISAFPSSCNVRDDDRPAQAQEEDPPEGLCCWANRTGVLRGPRADHRRGRPLQPDRRLREGGRTGENRPLEEGASIGFTCAPRPAAIARSSRESVDWRGIFLTFGIHGREDHLGDRLPPFI